MLDVRTPTISDGLTAPEAPPSPTHLVIRREDYRPPDWLIPEIELRFTLGIEKTRVQSKLSVERNPQARTGTNVFISSISGFHGYEFNAGYSGTKFALEGKTQRS